MRLVPTDTGWRDVSSLGGTACAAWPTNSLLLRRVGPQVYLHLRNAFTATGADKIFFDVPIGFRMTVHVVGGVRNQGGWSANLFSGRGWVSTCGAWGYGEDSGDTNAHHRIWGRILSTTNDGCGVLSWPSDDAFPAIYPGIAAT